MSTLSTRIKERMKAMGLNNAQLAAACNVKPPTSFNWASGKTNSIKGEPLLRAAKALGVTPEWLATGIGPMTIAEDRPDSFYSAMGGKLGVGAYYQDDEAVIIALTESDPAQRREWLAEAWNIHSRRGTQNRPSGAKQTNPPVVSEPTPAYLPERRPDPLTTELLHLFSQLDDISKREYLAHLRGFVAGRSPHPFGGATSVPGK